MLLKFLISDEQSRDSVTSLDVLDPRLPTRIARPPPVKQNPVLAPPIGKRRRTQREEWGGMKFFCSLTKICTPTAERMRAHMQGDFYKRMAAEKPDWDSSTERKELILDIEEE